MENQQQRRSLNQQNERRNNNHDQKQIPNNLSNNVAFFQRRDNNQDLRNPGNSSLFFNPMAERRDGTRIANLNYRVFSIEGEEENRR